MHGPELDDALARALAEAARESPGIALAPPLFEAHLRALLGGDQPLAALAALRTGELYLACACAHGDAHALAAFDERFLSRVAEYVAHIDRSADFADEVRQALRSKLLLPRGASPPLVAEYRGRGALGGWVRVAAVRTALDIVRQRKPVASPDVADALPAPGRDPELDAVRALCRDEFASALRGALAALDPGRRSALRLHYLDGLTLEETAAACGVSRATVARWLASGREDLLDGTMKALRERLRITEGELASVLRYARSELDLSLRRFL